MWPPRLSVRLCRVETGCPWIPDSGLVKGERGFVCVCVCWQQSSLRLSQSVRTSCCNNTTQHTLPTPGKSPNNAPHRRSLQLKAIKKVLTTAVLFDWHCCWEREASQWSYADIAILSDSLKEMCVSVFKICLGHILIYKYSFEKKTNIFWWINFIIFLL